MVKNNEWGQYYNIEEPTVKEKSTTPSFPKLPKTIEESKKFREQLREWNANFSYAPPKTPPISRSSTVSLNSHSTSPSR